MQYAGVLAYLQHEFDDVTAKPAQITKHANYYQSIHEITHDHPAESNHDQDQKRNNRNHQIKITKQFSFIYGHTPLLT